MKKICLLILFLSFNVFAADFEPQRIANGTVVDSTDSPYVWVFESNFEDPSKSFNGTGTLITDRHVVVAAHLVLYPNGPEHYDVKVNGQSYKVTKIDFPDSFNSNNVCNPSDIAILTLSNPVPNSVKPLPITTRLKDSKVKKAVKYYGYGCDPFNLDCSGDKADSDECIHCYGTLRKGTSKIVAREQDMVLLEKNGNTLGFAYNEGAPAVTVRASKQVIKKVKTKKGKIKKVKKTVTQDAIIGFWLCYKNPSKPWYDQQGEVYLLRGKKIINFIKKVTNRKAKFI